MNATTEKAADIRGSYRTQDGRAQIEWELRQKEHGWEFSASGEYDGGAGQCLDHIRNAYPRDEMVGRIHGVWSVYHLNGMQAGTPEQMRALEEEKEKAAARARTLPDARNYFYDSALKEINPHLLDKLVGLPSSLSYYDWACHVLKKRGLYEVPVNARQNANLKATGGLPKEVANGSRGYRYGERWLFLEIPAEVLAEIQSWKDAPQPVGSRLDHLTGEFLKRHGIECRITLSDSKPARWSPAGHHYRVTLSGKGRRLTFDFWGSAADAEARKHPHPSDVFSCIASDIHIPATFEEFLAEFGDEGDQRKARQTFNRCAAHREHLREFFTPEEIDALEALR